MHYNPEDLTEEEIRHRLVSRVASMCPKGVYVADDRDSHSFAFLICRDTASGREVLTSIPSLWIEYDEWTRVMDRLRDVCGALGSSTSDR